MSKPHILPYPWPPESGTRKKKPKKDKGKATKVSGAQRVQLDNEAFMDFLEGFVDDGRITSDYGWRDLDHDGTNEDFHDGIDIGPPEPGQKDVEVNSPLEGRVEFIGGDYGTINIRTGQGDLIQLMHFGSIDVKVGDKINIGDHLGIMGGTGPNGPNDYDIHLHIQIRGPDGKIIDPHTYQPSLEPNIPDLWVPPEPPDDEGGFPVPKEGGGGG